MNDKFIHMKTKWYLLYGHKSWQKSGCDVDMLVFLYLYNFFHTYKSDFEEKMHVTLTCGKYFYILLNKTQH